MVLISQILKRYLHKESFLVLVVSFVFTDKLSKVRLIHTRRTAIVTDTHVDICRRKTTYTSSASFLTSSAQNFDVIFFVLRTLKDLSVLLSLLLFVSVSLMFLLFIYLFIGFLG